MNDTPKRTPRKVGDTQWNLAADTTDDAAATSRDDAAGYENVPAERPGPVKRLGIYVPGVLWDQIRAAYLVDRDMDPPVATSIGRWIGVVTEEHTQRSPQRRARLAKSLDETIKEGRGAAHDVRMPAELVDAITKARVEDRKQVGRDRSVSDFITEAMQIGADRARNRIGDLSVPDQLPLTRPAGI